MTSSATNEPPPVRYFTPQRLRTCDRCGREITPRGMAAHRRGCGRTTLTRRQAVIAELWMQGLTLPDIAERVGRSQQAVEALVRNIYDRQAADGLPRSRAGLLVWAVRHDRALLPV